MLVWEDVIARAVAVHVHPLTKSTLTASVAGGVRIEHSHSALE
jgi:hypothetical protein